MRGIVPFLRARYDGGEDILKGHGKDDGVGGRLGEAMIHPVRSRLLERPPGPVLCRVVDSLVRPASLCFCLLPGRGQGRTAGERSPGFRG